MSKIYNVEPAYHTIFITAGDTIKIPFAVYKNDVGYDMTGMVLDIKVVDKYGVTVKTWASDGVAPCITISTSGFDLYDTSGFLIADNYNADIQLTDGSDIMTIAKCNIEVQKQITT